MKEKIAIVGIGCVFPDAPDFTEYWRNIVEGKDSVHDISGEFWDASAFYDSDPKAPDKTYSVMGAPVAPIEFDSMEFGLSPNVMQSTSTEQLFALIAARQAMIDAGLYGKNAKPFNREKTGVIISSPTGKNAFELSHRSEAPKIRMILVNNGIPEDVADRVVEKYKKTLGDWTEDNNPGYIPNVVAGRIANRFDLGGTSCSVDAACASSLASIKFAIDELQNGNCDVMLAGGASLDSSVTAFISFCKTPAISKKGKITPFDADADGMILGDGVGIVVMKRLSDAKRDGDKIYAVIRGVGTSGDGRAKSIYAPSKEGQIRALRRAYENAGVEAETIGLIEAHGTGTAAGDACEVSAISEVFHKENNSRDTIIGSVKSQIGHLRMSAGVAGLIKTALALHEKTLPASINMTTPNPTLVDSNLCVLSKPKAWIVNESQPVRRAAVSSFGFGGTNYHVVMEEADSDYDAAYRVSSSPMGVMFTGKTNEELAASIKSLAEGIETEPRMWYKDEYRYRKVSEGTVRLAFTAKTAAEAKEKCLKALELLEKNSNSAWVQSDIIYSSKPIYNTAQTTVLFSGQGTQEVDMLSEVAMGYPEMRRAITDADNVMLRENGTPVSKLVYPNCLTEEEKAAARETLMQTANTQPVLAAMEAGLYSVAVSRGLKANSMIGHSFGELVALWADGAWSYDTLIRSAKQRGAYMGAVVGDTAMTAVMADKQTVEKYIKEFNNVYPANENSASQTVVSGDRSEIEQLEKKLTEDGIKAVRLKVSGAFHSPYMAQAADEFRAFLENVEIGTSTGRVIANWNGEPYPTDDSAKIADSLKKQLVNPVLFRTSIENAYTQGARVFVEVGCGKVLSNLTKNILEGREHEVVTLCPDKNKDSMEQLEFAMAQLAILGYDISDDKYRVLPDEDLVPKKKKTSYSVNEEMFILPAKLKERTDAMTADPEEVRKNRESMAAAAAKAGIGVSLKAPEEKTVSEEPAVQTTAAVPAKGAMNTVKETKEAVKSSASYSDAKNLQALNAEVFAKFMDVQTSQLEAVTNILRVSQAKSEREKKDIMDCISQFQNNSLKAFQAYFASQTGAPITADVTVTEPETPIVVVPSSEVKSVPEAEAPAISVQTEPITVIPAAEEKPEPVPAAPEKEEKAGSNIAELVLSVVSEKTGYPTDMIDADMELETDLGIDSIKRVEILSEVNKKLGEIFTADDVTNLSTKGTVREITEYLESIAGNISADESEEPKDAEAEKEMSDADEDGASVIEKTVLESISEKTGYPTDMIDMEMELETDLGIDSIKRVEIFSAVLNTLNCNLSTDEIGELSSKSDIKSIVEYLSEKV